MPGYIFLLVVKILDTEICSRLCPTFGSDRQNHWLTMDILVRSVQILAIIAKISKYLLRKDKEGARDLV